MATQAHREGNARHIVKLDIIKIQPYKAEGAAIRAAAAKAGQSVQAYILDAIREKEKKESTTKKEKKERIYILLSLSFFLVLFLSLGFVRELVQWLRRFFRSALLCFVRCFVFVNALCLVIRKCYTQYEKM